MANHISAQHARTRLGEILDRVALRSEEYVIERDGRPMAGVVSLKHLEMLRVWSRAMMEDASRRLADQAASRPLAATADGSEDLVARLAKSVRRACHRRAVARRRPS